MKRIGMVVAVEMSAAIKKYKSKEVIKHGFRILETKVNNYELIIVNSTIGEIAAAAATELLISEYNVDLVVNFGLVGGLTETMSQTKLCIVDKVVHYDFDTSQIDPVKPGQYCGYPSEYIELNKDIINTCLKSYPNLKKVICASGDKFINNAEKKKELHNKYNADICEMELAAIVLTCNRANIPCFSIKIVSDGLFDDEKEYYKVKEEASITCLDLVDKIINEISL